MSEIISARMKKRSSICFYSEENVSTGDIFGVKIDDIKYYFIVDEVVACCKDILSVSAEEYGYYNMPYKKVGFDIRSLIGLDAEILSDDKEISKLKEESCYC